MKDKVKSAKIAVIISGVALVISLISLIFSIVTGASRASATTIFCAMVANFYAILSNYKSKKNNDRNSSKPM